MQSISRQLSVLFFLLFLIVACTPSILLEGQDRHQSITTPAALKFRERWTESSMAAYHKSDSDLRLKVFALETIPLMLDEAEPKSEPCKSITLRSITELPKVLLKYTFEGKPQESLPWSARDQWNIDACDRPLSFEVFNTRHGFHIKPVQSK
jgi:hypothetical protein